MSTLEALESPVRSIHAPHWINRAAFQLVVLLLAVNQACLAVSLYHNWYWLAAPLVLTGSHLMHGILIGFHEASHGLLRKNRRLNEIDGVLIGVLSLMSFSLYRAAHQSHHAYLAMERDEELWPFNQTSIPRWGRILAAVTELSCGILFTPFLFLRTFLRQGSPIRNHRVRRRVWIELVAIVAFWTVALMAVALTHTWKYFLWMHLLPAWIAGNMQSWRKYIEHVGLTGVTINSATRSIVPEGIWGRFLSLTLLHEPFHGLHHRHAGLPHAELPPLAAELESRHPDEPGPFPSYRAAFVDLWRSLRDPKVGYHWRTTRDVRTSEGALS